MNRKIIEQIRHIVKSENWPIGINEWPEDLYNLHCNMHPKDLSCIFAVKKSAS